MNTHSTPDANVDTATRSNGRRGFLGTLGGLAAAAAALPLLPAINRQQQNDAQAAAVKEPVQGNAFFD